MFTRKRLAILIFSVILCLPLFAACAQPEDDGRGTTSPSPAPSDPATTTTPDADSEPLTLVADGKPQYTIVRPEKADQTEINAAVAINQAIKQLCGSQFRITTDWERNPVVDSEICIGSLTRNGSYYELSADSLKTNEFRVAVRGTRLILIGATAYGTAQAAEWFISNYIEKAADSSTLTVPAGLDYTGSFELPTGLRIMTQNLLAGDDEYENYAKDPAFAAKMTAKLPEHTIARRAPRVLSLIETYKPDSLGVQECSKNWRVYFDNKLPALGYTRLGADKNEKIGIIYNRSTVKAIADGSFWLTEAPESLKISAEWGKASDGLTERLGMYVVFEVVATGERYIHFNTHLDTAKNGTIQTKQIEVILDYIATVSAKYNNAPVVLTGDFNLNSTNSAYKVILRDTLGDTRELCKSSSGGGSFNKFIGRDYASLPIDQIMATRDGFIFNSYKVIYDTFDGCFASDHYAVIADIEIKK